MGETSTSQQKNKPYQIIARAMCRKPQPNCPVCAQKKICVANAKKAEKNLKRVFFLTPRFTDSLAAAAEINSPREPIEDAQIVE